MKHLEMIRLFGMIVFNMGMGSVIIHLNIFVFASVGILGNCFIWLLTGEKEQ